MNWVLLISVLSGIILYALTFTKGRAALRYLFYFWILAFNIGPRNIDMLGIRISYVEGISWVVFFVMVSRLRIFFNQYGNIFPRYTTRLFFILLLGTVTAFSYGTNIAWIAWELKVFLTIIPIFFITYVAFRYLDVKFKTIINMFCAGGLILVLGSVLFYFFPSLARYLPKETISGESILVATEKESLFFGEAVFRRGGGSFWGSPLVSGYFSALFFIILIRCVTRRNMFSKIYYILFCALLAVSIVINGHRSVWIGLLLGLAFFAFFKGNKYIFMGAVILSIIIRLLPQEVILRFESIFTVSNASWAGRVSKYEDVISIIRQHPIIGIGLGSSAGWAHNFILQIWAGLGLLGLTVFLSWLGRLYFVAINTYRKSNYDVYLKSHLLAFLSGAVSYLGPLTGETVMISTVLVIPFWFLCAVLYNFSIGNISEVKSCDER